MRETSSEYRPCPCPFCPGHRVTIETVQAPSPYDGDDDL